MKMKFQIIIEYDGNRVVEELGCLQRGDLLPESLGITLREGKELLANVQKSMVEYQIEEYIHHQSRCPSCHTRYSLKEMKKITFRTLFGKMELQSPRFRTCTCQPQAKKSFSPLSERLPERTAPEFLYLQSKWSSLMSYGLSVDLLNEVLPLDVGKASVFMNTHKIAERIEAELGDENVFYIEGCQRDWEKLPRPDPPLTVGIDGGYVRARDGENRKAGNFEVIVGKSIQEEGETKRFALVHGYDEKPKRRVFDMLKAQGLQMNQNIEFISDGGETVRNLQLYLSPQAEHLLDWFHVTMRLTVMKQMSKGLPDKKEAKDIEKNLERIKWYLWHGNVYRALQEIEEINFDLEAMDINLPNNKKIGKLLKVINEFNVYISNNRELIPNYGERYRYGETISTAFVESTVNEIISRRMVKKQQMRWTKKGAHFLLQVRTKTLNNELKDKFHDWYPGMVHTDSELQKAA